MEDLKCIVYDEDKFIKELILNFIEKTNGVSSINSNNIKEVDIVFADEAFFDGDYVTELKHDAKVIVVSSNQKFIHSLFQNKISGYLNKFEINYDSFLTSIKKIRSQLSE